MIKLKEEFVSKVQAIVLKTIKEELNDSLEETMKEVALCCIENHQQEFQDSIFSDFDEFKEFKFELSEKRIDDVECFETLSDRVSSLVQYVSDGNGGFVDSLELRESIEELDEKMDYLDCFNDFEWREELESLEAKLEDKLGLLDNRIEELEALPAINENALHSKVLSIYETLKSHEEQAKEEIEKFGVRLVDECSLHERLKPIEEFTKLTIESSKEITLKQEIESLKADQVETLNHIHNLEQENQSLKDRLNTIENFLLNLSEGFKNA